MSTRTVGYIQLAMLPLLLALWGSPPSFGTLLQVVVCAAACAVAFQSGEKHRYALVAAFAGIAVLFNPMLPVVLSPAAFLWVGWVSVVMFLVALVLVKQHARVPITCIADAIRRSESVEAVWAWKH